MAPKLVVRRGDRLLLDNGLCRSRKEVVYFAGKGPSRTANCLENEVEVPDVRKLTLAEAQARVEAQPLTAELVYAPATPLQRPGIVVDQRPKAGYRSSYDRIILVVSKATQGVIPDLVGGTLTDARLRLEEAEDRAQDQLGRRKAWHDPPAEASRRPRGGSRRKGRARRR